MTGEAWDDSDFDLSDPLQLSEYLADEVEVCDQCQHETVVVEVLRRFSKVTIGCTRCGADLSGWVRGELKLPPNVPLVRIRTLDADGASLGLVDSAAEALATVQEGRPHVFRFGDNLCSVDTDGKLTELSPTALRVRMAEVAKWRNGRGFTDPPHTVVSAMLATASDHRSIPHLARVTTVPVFMPDGRILTTPGYDSMSETYLAPMLGDVDVPEKVTKKDVAAAVKLLTEDVLGDFPWIGIADKANAVAAMIQPFVRATIGPAPLYIFDAPESGTGKTLLADLVLMPGCGKVDPTGFSKSEAEQEKALLAVLRTAPSGVKLDNVRGLIKSQSLEALLTSTSGFWSARLLGASTNVTVPVSQTWCMTGNNAVIGHDLQRRSVWIRIDAGMERPARRSGPQPGKAWRHEMPEWALEHRPDLVRSCLVLCRWWMQHDMPKPVISPENHRGGFDRWEYTLGGILQCAGITGFLANAAERDDEDGEVAEVAKYLRELDAVYGSAPFTAREAFERGPLELKETIDGIDSARAFGMRLSSTKDRVAGGLVLRKIVRRSLASAWIVTSQP